MFGNSSKKKDKIFDNNYDNAEFDTTPIKFDLDSSFKPQNVDDQVHDTLLFKAIDRIIKDSKFSEHVYSQKKVKLNKNQMNELFT